MRVFKTPPAREAGGCETVWCCSACGMLTLAARLLRTWALGDLSLCNEVNLVVMYTSYMPQTNSVGNVGLYLSCDSHVTFICMSLYYVMSCDSHVTSIYVIYYVLLWDIVCLDLPQHLTIAHWTGFLICCVCTLTALSVEILHFWWGRSPLSCTGIWFM